MDDTVSVLIPAYNRAFCIGDCITSVLQQSHQKIEILVYDDGSTDATVNLLEKYKQVKVICGTENKGVSYARNRLIENCTTQYAAWHDSDDISNIYRIEEQLQFIKESNDSAVFCNWRYFSGSLPNERFQKPHLDLSNEDKCMGGSFIDLDKIGHIQFDEKINFGGEDFVWFESIKPYGYRVLNKMLYYMRQHSGRLSKLKWLASNRAKKELSDRAYAAALKKQ